MKRLLLDIETAPHLVYTWGLWNQNIALNQIAEAGYILCWAAKWYGEKKMHSASVYDYGQDEMLKKIHDLLDEADIVIHYNGAKFDIPRLNQEFLDRKIPVPSPFIQIDLLKTVRKKFNLPSNKLAYVTDYLGLGSKVNHKGMLTWIGCMEGDPASWVIMKKYNIQDVNILDQVYTRLLPWIIGHPNMNMLEQKGKPSCATCGSKRLHKRGLHLTKTLTYQRYQCQACGSWMRERTSNMDVEAKKNILVGVE